MVLCVSGALWDPFAAQTVLPIQLDRRHGNSRRVPPADQSGDAVSEQHGPRRSHILGNSAPAARKRACQDVSTAAGVASGHVLQKTQPNLHASKAMPCVLKPMAAFMARGHSQCCTLW